MARVSFLQTSMLGGRWSATAQGRMGDPAYKTALSECLNAYPQEEGSWTRRAGFRFLAHTRHGAQAIIRSFDWSPTEPFVLEFTDSKLRIFSANAHVIDSSCNVLDISTATPAVVTVDSVPVGWANGDSISFTLANDPCGPQAILCNRQFTIGAVGTGSFTLLDPISGANIGGSGIGYVAGASPDTADKILELATPYTLAQLAALRIVADDTTILILHPSHEPRLLARSLAGVWSIAAQDFSDGPYLDMQDLTVTTTTITLSGIDGSVTVTASDTDAINDGAGFKTTDVGRLIRFQGGPPLWDKNTSYHKSDQVTGSDGNIYVAQGGMAGLDPTMDDGTHWTVSSAHVNWISLKISAWTSTTVVTADVVTDLRDNGDFATVQGNANIRAIIGESGFPMLDSKLNQIDFTIFFAAEQSALVTNGAFTDGSGGDISATYTVRGVWNDPDDNISHLQFTTDGGQTSDWATVNGLTDHRTAYFSPSVGQTLAGDSLTTTAWQLGVYSDTSGWPACGTYHEGRLWLSGAASNRVDGSKSNDHFNFSPTAADGTIADDNAVAAIANATEQNTFFWMLSTENGLLLGTLAGEWLLRASSLDDPISDSSIQMRRVTTYGCANIEPQICLRTLAFVHRHGRRVMDFANYPWGEAAGWYADNLDHLAQDLTCGGIAELRYQQTPAWNLWMRRTDGVLVGSAFRHAAYGKESFNGWHRHDHGDDRIFESIAVGVSGIDGEGEQLYAVTNQSDADDPDYNVRWVEVLAPEFDGCETCDAFFVDSGPDICCATLTGGSTPTGLRLYGLWHLNGKSVQPFIGGLDLGDYTVANGFIDITFADSTKGHDASLFTLAFFQGLGTCALFGAEASLTVTATVTPANGPMSLMGLVGADTPVGYNAFGNTQFINHPLQRVIHLCVGSLTGSAGLKLLQTDVPGDELLQATETTIFGAGPAHTLVGAGACFHPGDGNFYCTVDEANSTPVAKVTGTTLVAAEVVGSSGASLSPSTCDATTGVLTRLLSSFQMQAISRGTNYYVASNNEVTGEVSVLNVTTTGSMKLLYAVEVDSSLSFAGLCRGQESESVSTFFGLARLSAYVTGFSTPHILYRYMVNGNSIAPANVYADNEAVKRTVVATLAPSDIDATWTLFLGASDPGYDQADGNVLAFFSSPSGPTNTNYLVKLDAFSGAVLWKLAVTLAETTAVNLPQCNIDGTLEWFTSGKTVKRIDLSTGAVTSTTTWNPGFSAMSLQAFDYLTGSITAHFSYSDGGSPDPVYLGDYLAAHSNAIPSNRWGRIYSGAPHSQDTTTDTPFYGSAGFTYTSRGQLLRPDFGQDGGAQAGPAFGKMRRITKAAWALVNARGISVGTDFNHLHVVPLASAGGTAIASPTLFTGTVAFKDMQIDDNYGTDSRLCWEVTRPYPCTVTAIAGSLDTKDE